MRNKDLALLSEAYNSIHEQEIEGASEEFLNTIKVYGPRPQLWPR